VRSFVLLLAVAALAGCGLYHWSKPGADGAAFQRDSAECQQQSGVPGQQQSGGNAPPVAGQAGQSNPWEACMNGRGWHYSNWW
jgi:predicted small lipoprotein YifL